MAVFSYWLLRIYVIYRWARLTTRQYGMLYLAMSPEKKPRHAACGRAHRDTNWGRAHGESTGWNITTGEIVAMLAKERERECTLV